MQFRWEVYCEVSLSSNLRCQEGTAIQMGGVLPHKLEVYFLDKLQGLGAPSHCPLTCYHLISMLCHKRLGTMKGGKRIELRATLALRKMLFFSRLTSFPKVKKAQSQQSRM